MASFTIIISPNAKKQLDLLPLNIKVRVGDILKNIIAKNPLIGKSLKAELQGHYSYRVGDYRIIYRLIKNRLIVYVIKIMHRREVYR